ncbi:hypothetical protein D3C81_2142990 [compost metagenome]
MLADRSGHQAVEARTVEAVAVVEGAVRPGTGVHVHHAQLSASMGRVARNGRVLGKRPLAAG